MEDNKASNSSQGLGIAGFVLSIIALIISFIPCLGLWPLMIGIIALMLSAIGYFQAGKVNAPIGIIIAALIISLLGCGNALRVYQNTKEFSTFFRDHKNIEKIGKEFQKAVEDELDESDLKDLEEAMEELEGEIEEITEGVIEEASETASEAIKEFAKEVEKVAKELDEDEKDGR